MRGVDFMTIHDLVYDTDLQGNVVIQKIHDTDLYTELITMYEGEYGIFSGECEELMEKEIAYIYAANNAIVIEYYEEEG